MSEEGRTMDMERVGVSMRTIPAGEGSVLMISGIGNGSISQRDFYDQAAMIEFGSIEGRGVNQEIVDMIYIVFDTDIVLIKSKDGKAALPKEEIEKMGYLVDDGEVKVGPTSTSWHSSRNKDAAPMEGLNSLISKGRL